MKKCLTILLLITANFCLQGQILDSNHHLALTLSDGLKIDLYKARGTEAYYYIPTHLRVSQREETPEFSFLAFDEEGDGVNDGAIMHLLLTWGLDKEQEKEAVDLLKEEKGEGAMIWGAAQVQALKGEAWKLYHNKDKATTALLSSGQKSSPQLPVYAGGKWATSFRWDAKDYKKMEDLLKDEKELKQVCLELNYQIRFQHGMESIQLKKSLYELIGAFIPTNKD